MDIRFLDVAQDEFDEAVEYYNKQAPGLGESERSVVGLKVVGSDT